MLRKHLALIHYRNMYLVALASGQVSPATAALLDAFAQDLNITPEDQEVIRDQARFLEFLIPNDSKHRLYCLESLMQVMLADGQIHPKQYYLCWQYASVSGCDELVLNILIEKVQESANPSGHKSAKICSIVQHRKQASVNHSA